MTKAAFENSIEILGRPDYITDRVAIYNTDCLEAMGRLPTDLIDLTVTSPPYNIGKEYEFISDLTDYVAWCKRWIEQIHRVSRDNAAFWLNLGYLSVPSKGLAVPIPYLLWDKTDFFLLQEVVWNYGAGVACRTRFSPRNEKLLWYVKDPENYVFNLDEVRDPDVKYPNQKKNGKLKCNPNGKNPSDVWQIAKVTSGSNRSSKERTPHPAQFPIEMISRIVKACTNRSALVLDPFMGSGSTAEVAVREGRYVIGFELEKKYIKYAADRLDALAVDLEMQKAQGALFGGVESLEL